MVGDFNTFQFNDGYVDVLNTIAGDPAPADEVVKATSDFVNPNLEIIEEEDAAEHYSFEFDGNAQALDHALVTANLAGQVTIEHARNNADFPESYRIDGTRPERSADHDMFVAFLTPQKHFTVSAPDTIAAGSPFDVTVTARNIDGTVDTTYTGTIHFTSSDASAALPADYTFIASQQGVADIAVVLNATGAQTVTVTDTVTASQGTATTTVTCGAAAVDVENSGPVCAGGEVTLSATLTGALPQVPVTYSWTGPNGYTSSAGSPLLSGVTASQAGTYTLVATYANGCVYGGSTQVVVNAAVNATITAPSSVLINSTNNTASVASVPGAVYNWTVTGSSVSSGQGTNSITFPAGAAGTTLTISVSVTSGGCTANASVKSQTDFLDVDPASGYRNFINTIARNSITGGCGAGNYCPSSSITRAQMAVFLLVAKYGAGYVPPVNATSTFDDVDVASPYSKWIEKLYELGITGGCGGNNFCPGSPVTRQQMAVFLLVAKEGSGYLPPDAAGVFGDVPVSSAYARWIEELAARNVTGGCGGGNYCPLNPVTRAQMAVFLTLTFGLQ
jgi:hypothetical protein